MREKIVAGNWKMNKTLKEGLELASEINQQIKKNPVNIRVIIAPPYIHLDAVSKVITDVYLSAQNCSSESSGAFTGEISAEMIKSTGAEYVIIGHSERRTYFREDDETLLKKVNMALAHGLIPIFCCGEHLSDRESGNHFGVVKKQLDQTVFILGEADFKKLVIAYEPVWAIGTGVNATPEQAQEMHHYIRKLINDRYNQKTADDTSILYGGSCKPSNAGELFSNPDVDGGLIGGASLEEDSFLAIVHALLP